MVILLSLSENSHVTFYVKTKNICNVWLIKAARKIVFHIFSLDIFIWFDRVQQALQEYKYLKKFDPIFQYKIWKKSKRVTTSSYILH